MPPDIATLSAPVAPVAATNEVEIMAIDLQRRERRLAVRYRIGSAEARVVFVPLGASAMNTVNTAIAGAIKADIAGNPDVTLT